MRFDEILAQVLVLLQQQKHVLYADIRTQFNVDEETLKALQHQLIEVKQLAIDQDGTGLVCTETAADDMDARQLTVLFCDVVGSTALSGALDPEDLREVMRHYQQVSLEVIEHFDGHLAQYLGDGLMVYFGYPTAHEDDVQRAVAAGLRIIEALAVLNERLDQQRGVQLAVRIGIHSGSVIVGELGHGQEQLAMGETPNIAASIQTLAEPDTVVVSEATAELLADEIPCEPMGTYRLDALHTPVRVSRVRATDVGRHALTPTESAGLADEARTTEVDGADDAERRQLTVMFCDLAGAEALAIDLTPEALLEVVRAYQSACANLIAHFDGYIAQYLNDGLLVYFGYPQAHEDDAQRAVRAALGIIEGMAQLNENLVSEPGVQVAARIGIHTGLVVAGEMGGGRRTEQFAVGETLNLAARIQRLAAPDTVTISAATKRLIAGHFWIEDSDLRVLRGVAEPVQVSRVVSDLESQGYRAATTTVGRTQLVGRVAELKALQDRWTQSVTGQGQVVLLSGEAGIGKSHLVDVLREVVGHEGALQVTFRGSPYHRNSALHPIIVHMERMLQFGRQETPAARWAKLERVLGTYRFPAPDTLPLMAKLFSIPLPSHVPPFPHRPAQQKLRIQELLLAWLMEDVERQPILTVCEDLHWMDPSTLDLLGLLIDRAASEQMLVLMTCRLEFQSPWEVRSNLTSLYLNRLEGVEIEAMVARVTSGKTLPSPLLEQILSRTDGVPLFVEEMTKTILESGVLREINGRYELIGRLSELAIPSTLQDSLMARLDRLGNAKRLAQLGAVIGRESPYELLLAVWDGDEAALQTLLAQLVEAEILQQRGPLPQAVYTFKHALIQDTAYQSLLRSTRQRYHQQIAEVLETRFANIVDTQPELLARHYSEASRSQQAVGYWLRAGRLAIQRSANTEAIQHLTAGLNALQIMPETPERIECELTFRLAMGSPLIATRGYAAPEVRDHYARARALSQHLQEIPRRLQVLMGLWMFYAVRAELHTAQELAEQLLSLSQSQPDPAMFLEAEQSLGITLSMRGLLAPAREHFEQGIAIYDPDRHRDHPFVYGQDSKVVCLCHVATVLWLLGEPDAALARCHEALHLARSLAHPFSRSWALYYTAMVHQLRREAVPTQEYAEALIALCQDQGFTYRQLQGNILRSWALSEQGLGATEIDPLRQGLEAVRATGAEVYRPYYLAILADVYAKVGQHQTALTGLDEILAIVETTHERFYEAELHRLKGEMLMALGNTDDRSVDSCFHLALHIARQQGAKSLELRTALSRSRLWQRQGRPEAARELLAEVTARFSPELETPELRSARQLLAQLA